MAYYLSGWIILNVIFLYQLTLHFLDHPLLAGLGLCRFPGHDSGLAGCPCDRRLLRHSAVSGFYSSRTVAG